MEKKDLFEGLRGTPNPAEKLKPTAPKKLNELVGALRADDGVDPRLEARQRARKSRPGRPGRAHGEHKQAQLFAQVKDALDAALLAAGNPVLNAFTVVEVTQNRGSLGVVVQPRNPADALDLNTAAQALEAAHSMLRREVAEAISRKETPTLRFIIVPANSGGEKAG
jgi:ribosome-binding factor A